MTYLLENYFSSEPSTPLDLYLSSRVSESLRYLYHIIRSCKRPFQPNRFTRGRMNLDEPAGFRVIKLYRRDVVVYIQSDGKKTAR